MFTKIIYDGEPRYAVVFDKSFSLEDWHLLQNGIIEMIKLTATADGDLLAATQNEMWHVLNFYSVLSPTLDQTMKMSI